jgi:hypothetical protein
MMRDDYGWARVMKGAVVGERFDGEKVALVGNDGPVAPKECVVRGREQRREKGAGADSINSGTRVPANL